MTDNLERETGLKDAEIATQLHKLLNAYPLGAMEWPLDVMRAAAEALARRPAGVEAAFDANVNRLKACEHIADGDEGWEALRNECPSTAAVARLRDGHIKAVDALKKIRRTPNRPFPDPGAHSVHVYAAALRAAWGDIQRIAEAALTSPT